MICLVCGKKLVCLVGGFGFIFFCFLFFLRNILDTVVAEVVYMCASSYYFQVSLNIGWSVSQEQKTS